MTTSLFAKFLFWSCGLCFAIVASLVAGAETKLTDAELEAKAIRLQGLVEEKMLQAHGMVPMFVRASDYHLPTADDYQGAYKHRHLEGKTEAEVGLPPMHVWRAWENTPSNTAFYLHAMSHKYRVTGDPEVLAICRRTLGALKYIHQLAVDKGERGFLTKPYGGVYSNQTSGDQVQCVVWGLAAYRPIAHPDDVATIDEMTRDFADHQMETGYIALHGYFGRTRDDLLKADGGKPSTWKRAAIFAPLLTMAWYGTGDPRYVEEIERLTKQAASQGRYRARTDRFSTNGFGGKRDVYLPAMLMEMAPQNQATWREAMLTNYRQAATGVLPDGTFATAWSYDAKRGGMTPQPMPSVGGGLGRTGRSAVFAMGSVAAQRWFADEEMQGTARHILEHLDEPTFRFLMPWDNDHPLPAEWQVESELLDGDSLTGWLCAYWEGRWRGYW